ncbi:MAG: hypothetical protein QOD81_1148 [Solirubrobacteraceae bacterium]|jgi:hypothetical protein|nr:hypothetical protein [Solirubrobacteraceae bacterium]
MGQRDEPATDTPGPGGRVSAILQDIVAEGERLLDRAQSDGVEVRLLGGVAVRLHAPTLPAAFDRQYKDLDFVAPKGGAGGADRLLRGAGYEPHTAFNALNSKERMLYFDTENDRQVDVFVGAFRMCHEIPLSDRLGVEQRTVPLAELLLTKLQIVELNEKDVRDTLLLVHGHDVSDHDGDAINGARIAELCASDWGLWRTITANVGTVIEHAPDYDVPAGERELMQARLREVLDRIEAEPKGRGWKLRARIGERKRWYELPEEVDE